MSSLEMTDRPCDACGEGTLTPSQRLRRIEYGGRVGDVLLRFSKCNVCRSELTNEEQSVLNRRAVNRFKKEVDGSPLGSQIRAMRKTANLTQIEAGALLGGGPVAFSKYENDDLLPDRAMATLLQLLISDPSLINQIKAIRGATSISTKKTFGEALPASPASMWVDTEDTEEDGGEVPYSVAVVRTEPFEEPARSPWGPH
jgi:putative zinc finger/helix-turn-helix YgiT family protein